MKTLIALTTVASLAMASLMTSAFQGCGTPSPGSGWVCQDGGWLPPGHPGIRPSQAPTPPPEPPPVFFQPGAPLMPVPSVDGENAALLAAIANGWELPAGEVRFTPPLLITGFGALRGHPSGRTTLVPTTDAAGPLIVVHAMASVNLGPGPTAHDLWTLGPQLRVERLAIRGGPQQTCLVVRAVNLRLRELVIGGCHTAIRYEWAVNTTLEDSNLEGNAVGLDIAGYGPVGPTGSMSVTTLTVLRTRIASSSAAGVSAGHGLGIVFDGAIIESNPGAGLSLVPTFDGAALEVLLRDTWFEQNGAHLVGRVDLVQQTGLTRIR